MVTGIPGFRLEAVSLRIYVLHPSSSLYRPFSTSVGSIRCYTFCCKNSEPHLLILDGFVVDRISAVVTLPSLEIGNPLRTLASELPAYRVLVQGARGSSLSSNRKTFSIYGDIRDLWEACWRTLIADSDPETGKRPKWFSDMTNRSLLRRLYHHFVIGVKSLDRYIYEEPYYSTMRDATSTRHIFETKAGRIDLAPPKSRSGDLICMFLGGRVPFIVRPAGHGSYQLIRECYTYGLMDGEAVKDVKAGTFKLKDIVLC